MRTAQGIPVRVAVAVAAALGALFAVSVIPGVRAAGGFDDFFDGWVQGGAYVAIAVVAVMRPLRDPFERPLWLFVALAVTLRAIGFVVYLGFVRNIHPQPYPSAADVFWLIVPVALLCALALQARTGFTSAAVGVALDGVVGACAGAAIGIAAMTGTVLRATAPAVPDEAVPVNLAYPLLDLMLLVAVVGVLAIHRWRMWPALALLATGIVGFAVVDSVFLYQITENTYRPGTPLAAISLLATGAIAAAAFAPRRTPTTSVAPQLYLPAVFALLCLGVLVYGTRHHVPLAAVLLAALGIAIEAGRIVFAFRDQLVVSARLRRERDRLSAVLEGTRDYAIIGGRPGQVTFFSRGAEVMLGYRADEVIGKMDPLAFHDPDEIAARSPDDPGAVVAPPAGTEGTAEWTYVRKDGSRLPVALTLTRLGRGEFLGIARDITRERRAAQHAQTRDAVVRVLAAAENLETGLAAALATLVRGEGWDAAMLWLVEDDELRCAVVTAGEDDAARRAVAVRAWQKARTQRDGDIVATPLRSGDEQRTLGVLEVVAPGDQTAGEALEAIGARVGRHVELSGALEAAERANRTIGEFVTRISHELRTPLNAILGFAQVLERDLSSRAQREQVEQIADAGSHLLALIDDLLDLGRLERGELRLQTEPVAATDAVRSALDLVRPLVYQRDLDLDVDMHGGLFTYVRADPQRLRQVLLNLLSNAVKYNRPGGRVAVSFTVPGEDRLRFCVGDTGPGVGDADLPRLFRPFDRLGRGAGDEPGTGLGLPVSQALVHAMGGEIGVDSTVGEGTTFWVELDRVETPEAAPAPAPAPAPDGTGDLAGHVLYIEDNPANIRLVEDVLAAHPGVELWTAGTGRSGIALAIKRRPAVILLDAQLPDLDGEQVLELLAADPEVSDIPVVVLSADVSDARRRALLDRGAAGYVGKPFAVDEFVRVVGEALAH